MSPTWNRAKISGNHKLKNFFPLEITVLQSENVYGTAFLQGNLGEIQVYCTSLKVHHGHFRGLFLVFIALLLIIIKRRRACTSKLHKIQGVLFFRFVGQLLEHPVWRHLQLPVDYFCQFSGKFEKPCSLILPFLHLRDDIVFKFGSISEKKAFDSRNIQHHCVQRWS